MPSSCLAVAEDTLHGTTGKIDRRGRKQTQTRRLTRTRKMTRTTQVSVAAMSCVDPSSCFPALLLRYLAVASCRLCCMVSCEACTISREAGSAQHMCSEIR